MSHTVFIFLFFILTWTTFLLECMQVFILGYGNIGMALAKRLKPFGVKIIATKRNWDTHSEDLCQSNGV